MLEMKNFQEKSFFKSSNQMLVKNGCKSFLECTHTNNFLRKKTLAINKKQYINKKCIYKIVYSVFIFINTIYK